MDKTVCRAFTLYHDKIFAAPSEDDFQERLKKDYIVIGYFDWFKTTKWDMDSSFSLTELFRYNNQISKEGTAFQSFQNIFGFRRDVDSSVCTDADFWSDECDECLRFVLYLQMENFRPEQFSLIETILGEKAINHSFVVYYTLDKNDFIVCLKSESYNNIINVINHLYDRINNEVNRQGEAKNENKDIIIYSYTCLIVKYDVLNNPTSFLIAEKEEEEIIHSICIKTILNNYNEEHHSIKEKIHRFCCDLSKVFYGSKSREQIKNKEIVGYEILGDTDCRIIAREVPLNRLLSLFSTTGLLNRNNKLFKYSFISSMTSLNLDTKKNTEYCNIENYKSFANRTTIQISRDKIDAIDFKFEQNDIGYVHLITLLYQIYDYISFVSYQTSKYEFVSLQQPFELLIRLIETALKNEEAFGRPFDELYEYLSNMYSNIQENMRTDIRFYGLSDFSVMSYYSPTKLRSFYFFVISKIAEYYKSMSEQDAEIDYQFMIFFSNTATTNVTQLWKTKFDEDKLMMIRIAEKEFYEVKDLVFQLAHEAAHFVGNEDIRNRKFRFYQYVNFLLSRINVNIKKRINEELLPERTTSNASDSIPFKIIKLLDEASKDNPLNLFLSNNQELLSNRMQDVYKRAKKMNLITKEKHFYYMDIAKSIIADYLFNDSFVLNIFNEYYNCLFGNIKRNLMAKINDNAISIADAKEVMKVFNILHSNLSEYIYGYQDQLLFAEISDSAFAVNVLYEAYADLSAVLLFDLSATDFCEIMLKRLDLSDSEYYKNMIFIRMCIVLKAMSSMVGKYECINPSFASFFEKIPYYWEIKGNEQMNQFHENIKNVCKTMDDHEFFLSYLYDYINLCLEKQCSRFDDKKRQQIKNIYESTNNDELLETVIYINDFVAKLGRREDE